MAALGKRGIYVRNQQIIQGLAGTEVVVFDKTGTLTAPEQAEILYGGTPLTKMQEQVIGYMTAHSLHPLSQAISAVFPKTDKGFDNALLTEFPGQGIEMRLQGDTFRLGSAAFIGIGTENEEVSDVYFSQSGQAIGAFRFSSVLRDGVDEMLESLSFGRYGLYLLSGDRPEGLEQIQGVSQYFDDVQAQMLPEDKELYLRTLRAEGKQTLMVGDGINDAGAMQAADLGIAVIRGAQCFTPNCDILIEAKAIGQLDKVLSFSRRTLRNVVIGFWVSVGYNAVGLSLAVQGSLSPMVAAILMPISSLTVVAVSVFGTQRAEKKIFTAPNPPLP
jgi:Cu+-exporting ATPase